MLQLNRTTSSDPNFQALVKKLDAYLAVVDGDEHAFYDQYNGLEDIRHVVLAYADGQAVGCGAIKPHAGGLMEVKRMFVLPKVRAQGIAQTILQELEAWAAELGAAGCLLETGLKQTEAIRLYEKSHYQRIPNYEPYAGLVNSVCFQKYFNVSYGL